MSDDWEVQGKRYLLVNGLENLALGWLVGDDTTYEVVNTETGQTGEVTVHGDEDVGSAIAEGRIRLDD